MGIQVAVSFIEIFEKRKSENRLSLRSLTEDVFSERLASGPRLLLGEGEEEGG